MDFFHDANRLLQTIETSTSPFQAIKESARQLEQAGFSELYLGENWILELGKGYYINVYGSTLIGFRANNDFIKNPSCRIAASHTDWPCLRVKPSPEVVFGNYGKLNVEVYGGPILNTWFDRPLSLSGRVTLKGKATFQPIVKLVDFNRTLLTIPNLAIHMNREVNKGVELNAQIDMLPIITMLTDDGNKNLFLMDMLAKELDVPKEDIFDFELYIYNRDKGEIWGRNQEFISAPRLDNLTSVQASVTGLLNSSRKNGLDVIALFDNEEIGSHTKQGADSALLGNVLEKIHLSFGINRQGFLTSIFNSILLSMDVAHAIHPNKPEKSDITNQIYLNEGIAIKINSRQAYATDSNAIGIIEGICKNENIPYKKYANRSDIVGGGTLGSLASAGLAMKAVDVGVPILAMHSSKETMGLKDQKALVDLVQAFFSQD